MAGNTRDLLFRFLGDAKDLGRATRDAKRHLDETDTAARRSAGGFDKMKGAVAGLGVAAGAAALGRFAWDAAEMAGAAETAARSAEKVLGPALDDLHDDLEDVRGTLGLNTLELDTIIGRFGLLTEGYNLTDDAQAEFIGGLIDTAGELAAFSGDVGRAPEAIDAMGGALRGEFDSLEQFGIKLSEAAIQERELELRADPANEALTDQEIRIKAVTDLINEKAAPAIGSLADAQDTMAGKVNEATTKWEDFKIKLGEKVLPVIVEAGEDILDLIYYIETGATGGDTFAERQFAEFHDWLTAIKDVATWLGIVDEQVRMSGGGVRVYERSGGGYRAGSGGATQNSTRGRGSAPINPNSEPGLERFASGGIVGGPLGQPRAIVAHGGEYVGPDSPGGGVTIYVQAGLGNPHEIARTIVSLLQTYERSNGALPVSVRGN